MACQPCHHPHCRGILLVLMAMQWIFLVIDVPNSNNYKTQNPNFHLKLIHGPKISIQNQSGYGNEKQSYAVLFKTTEDWKRKTINTNQVLG